MLLRTQHRHAAATVEFAIVTPVTLLLIFGILVVGMGVFRYQQVAHLAREASRYAAVRGTQYARDTGNAAATPTSIHQLVIVPGSTAMNLSQLSSTVTWNQSNSPTRSFVQNGTVIVKANIVTVTINYNWIPETFFGGGAMTSTSASTMYY